MASEPESNAGATPESKQQVENHSYPTREWSFPNEAGYLPEQPNVTLERHGQNVKLAINSAIAGNVKDNINHHILSPSEDIPHLFALSNRAMPMWQELAYHDERQAEQRFEAITTAIAAIPKQHTFTMEGSGRKLTLTLALTNVGEGGNDKVSQPDVNFSFHAALPPNEEDLSAEKALRHAMFDALKPVALFHPAEVPGEAEKDKDQEIIDKIPAPRQREKNIPPKPRYNESSKSYDMGNLRIAYGNNKSAMEHYNTLRQTIEEHAHDWEAQWKEKLSPGQAAVDRAQPQSSGSEHSVHPAGDEMPPSVEEPMNRIAGLLKAQHNAATNLHLPPVEPTQPDAQQSQRDTDWVDSLKLSPRANKSIKDQITKQPSRDKDSGPGQLPSLS